MISTGFTLPVRSLTPGILVTFESPAHNHLLRRHFQTENPDSVFVAAVFAGDAARDLQSESRFARARAAGDNHKIARMQARRHAIEIGDAGFDSFDRATALERVDRAVFESRRLFDDRNQAAARVVHALPDLQNARFGAVEQLPDFGLAGLVGVGARIVQRLDHFAQQRLIAHDARVFDQIGRRRGDGHQFGQIIDAARVIEFAFRAQRVGDRDRINVPPARAQKSAGAKNQAVARREKILGIDDVADRVVVLLPVQQNRAQYHIFGVDRVRRARRAVGRNGLQMRRSRHRQPLTRRRVRRKRARRRGSRR